MGGKCERGVAAQPYALMRFLGNVLVRSGHCPLVYESLLSTDLIPVSVCVRVEERERERARESERERERERERDYGRRGACQTYY